VDKIANSAARLSVKVWDLTAPGGRNEITDSPLAKLLRDPCSEMSAYNFWRWTFSTYEVYGEAFWRKIRDGRRAGHRPDPDASGADHGEAGRGGNVVYVFSIGVAEAGILELPAEDVVAFLRWNPANVMRGMSRLEPLASTLANEDAARRATGSMWNVAPVRG
jgi:phage portal protein BeeE